jgi:hypothetical protein
MPFTDEKLGKEGQAREIRKPPDLRRFAFKSNKRNGKVATRERGFESLRPEVLTGTD